MNTSTSFNLTHDVSLNMNNFSISNLIFLVKALNNAPVELLCTVSLWSFVIFLIVDNTIDIRFLVLDIFLDINTTTTWIFLVTPDFSNAIDTIGNNIFRLDFPEAGILYKILYRLHKSYRKHVLSFIFYFTFVVRRNSTIYCILSRRYSCLSFELSSITTPQLNVFLCLTWSRSY